MIETKKSRSGEVGGEGGKNWKQGMEWQGVGEYEVKERKLERREGKETVEQKKGKMWESRRGK